MVKPKGECARNMKYGPEVHEAYLGPCQLSGMELFCDND